MPWTCLDPRWFTSSWLQKCMWQLPQALQAIGVDKQIAQNRTLTWLLLATTVQAAADLNNRPAIDADLLEHMENSCLNNVLCLFCILNEKKVRKEQILIWRCVIFFVLVAPSGVYVKNYFFWKICAHRIVHSQ